jgi:hypothetical protein
MDRSARPHRGARTQRLPPIEEAAQRLSTRNKRLTPELALHLARHGVRQDADGLYRWKFDHYQRARAPYRLSPDDHTATPRERETVSTVIARSECDEAIMPPQAAKWIVSLRSQ